MTNIKKLTRDEFSRAIKLGHGRALLHVKEYGDDSIEDAIKESLLTSHAYDVQIEGLRTWWLWQIVTLTGKSNSYADHLLSNFNLSTHSHHDVAQQFELASMFFDLGRIDFRPAMFADFQRMAHEPGMSSCGRAMVEVSGLAGLEMVAKTCGESPEIIDDYECNKVLERAIANGYERTVMEHMSKLAEKEPTVKVFMDACEQFNASSGALSERSQPTLEELLMLIEQGELNNPGKFKAFGRRATADELAQVSNLLKHASTERDRLAFLQVFHWVAMPQFSTDTLKLLSDNNAQIRMAAAKALSHSKSPDIRNTALSMLQSGESSSVSIALDLLKNNYTPDDSQLVMQGLRCLKLPFDIHAAGMAVKNICRTSQCSELAPAILWLYEHGPDTFCRLDFVEQLVEWQKCPPDLLYEAQWDAGSELRDFARNQIVQI